MSTSNRLAKRLLELASGVSVSGSVVLTLTPATPLGTILQQIQNIASEAVDARCVCFAIDFKTAQNITACYRTFDCFEGEGVRTLLVPEESRIFLGHYLGVMYPAESISGVRCPKVALVNTLLLLSFSNIDLGEISLTASIDRDGKLGPFISGETIMTFPSALEGTALKGIKTSLREEVIFALRSAASASTIRGKFVFTWIALEFLLGSGSDRRDFIESLGSMLISDRMRKIREVRAGILKSSKDSPQIRRGDIPFLMDIMRLYLVEDCCRVRENVKRIEERLRAEEREDAAQTPLRPAAD